MPERSLARPWPPKPPRAGRLLVAGRGTYPEETAAAVAGLIREAADARPGPVSVMLAGGSTPRPVYEALAATADIPWTRLEIFFGDERAVPPVDADSNYRMARESLLDRTPIPPSQVHRMEAEAPELGAAAREYADRLPPHVDLVLLGIGTDGHTASLFPGAPTLWAERRVEPATSPKPPRRRLTVTPPVLRDARRIAMLACGSAKAGPVARALTGEWDPARCPAQLARRGSWLLDRPAAAELPAAATVPDSPGEGAS